MDNNAVTIRFATFLSPILYGTYEHIARYIGEKVDCPTTLRVGQSFEEFAEGQIDVAFICGLPYVHMASQYNCPVELLAALFGPTTNVHRILDVTWFVTVYLSVANHLITLGKR